MLENLKNCPSCGNKRFTLYLQTKDFFFSKESFQLSMCKNCSLVFTNPRPSKEDVYKYYLSENYISHSDKKFDITSIFYRWVRNIALTSKLKLINSLNANSKKILDFGCGTGHFLQKVHSNGWIAHGIEPNKTAIKNSPSTIRHLIFESLNNIEEKYNIISAWHVIEHIHELHETLKSLIKRLNDKGTLIIAVPNLSSFDSQYYGNHWAGLDAPRHLYHFSNTSFLNLINSLGLKLIQVKPMIFDSFYVSLLSEKYRGTSFSYLKALIVGMKSNRLAKKNNQYSSLIYILKK